jgi:hypothetical protein
VTADVRQSLSTPHSTRSTGRPPAAGQVVWKSLAGTGVGFNNNYAGLTVGRDGTAYLGTLGGIIAMRDTT